MHLALAFLLHPSISPATYLKLRDWLDLPSLADDRHLGIPSTLIQAVTECLPQNSHSTHFFRIHQWTAIPLADLSQHSLQELTDLVRSPDMKARLTTAFANYRTLVSLPYTPALESINSRNSEQYSAQKSHLSPQSLSALDMLLAKGSHLL